MGQASRKTRGGGNVVEGVRSVLDHEEVFLSVAILFSAEHH